MVKRTTDWKYNFTLSTGELHETVQWMREAAETGNQVRLRDEIQYAAKLLKQATDQFVILVEKKLGESVTSGEPVTTHELSTSLGEEKCINDK